MNAELEMSNAQKSLELGNEGKARVCVRRACGEAITFWLRKNNIEGWGESAMSQLKKAAVEKDLPEEVIQAAQRLTARVNGMGTLPFTESPIEDGKIIIEYFLNK